jgi:O-acetyl-ADP-ribose deacetylase (regulator of RNase III)
MSIENLSDNITFRNIPVWSVSIPPDYDILVDDDACLKQSAFSYDPQLNDKLSLWMGPIVTLDTDAIVSLTNESLDEQSPQNDTLMQAAGPDLRRDLAFNVRRCKTGDAKITKGYKLPAKFVIHTVGPRYHAQYKTAAENALYSCYRNVLRLAYENKLSSLAVCCIHTLKRGYPPFEAAHIAIRTVRRFLEKYGDEIERIIFVLDEEEEEIYQSFMPLYFPRSKTEEQYMAYQLPIDIGNSDGEPVVEERRIKIIGLPKGSTANDENENENGSLHEVNNAGSPISSAVKQHAFLKMEEDVDAARQKRVQRLVNKRENVEAVDAQKRYEAFAKSARRDDLSSLAALRCFYQTGFDRYQRPILVFMSKHCVLRNNDPEKMLKYFVRVMDDVVKSSYVIVYVNTLVSAENQLNVAFLRSLYDISDDRYKRNLGALYVLHPTFQCKSTLWLFTSFAASDLKSKIHYIRGLEYLYRRMSPDQIDLPDFVAAHDQKINGIRYYSEEEDRAIGEREQL